MENPFKVSKARPGYGAAHVSLLPPSTPVYKTLNYTYPLKLIASSPHVLEKQENPSPGGTEQASRLSNVPLLFMLTYGGGLLPRDSISLDVMLEPSTRLTLATQGSTKVFPSSRDATISGAGTGDQSSGTLRASQRLSVKLGAHSALLLSPDPVQPFGGSHYTQVQIFEADQSASLGLLDWVSSGRPARNETWDAGSWTGRNEIWRCNPGNGSEVSRRLLLRDALYLEDGPSGIGQRTLKEERKGVFGTFILLGPVFEAMGKFFLAEFSSQPKIGGYTWDDDEDDAGTRKPELERWRKERLAREEDNEVLWTASRVRGIFVVKFAARETEGAKDWLHDMFQREGTIDREFGPGGLLSVR